MLLDVAYGEDGAGAVLTTGTSFQIASISKSFAAACILLLVERGCVGFEDELTSWVDGSPSAWQGITVRHLVSHTSGLGHWPEVAGLDPYNRYPRQELIGRFAEPPLHFRPGTGWRYSSPGYVLIAHIVEEAGEMPYPAFLEANILQPLQMRHTAAVSPASGATAARGSAAGRPVQSWELSNSLGAGDVWSTTEDLARWPRALASPTLLTAESRTMVFDPLAAIAAEQDGLTDLAYACGWYTGRLDGHRLIVHPGDMPGFTSLLAWAPEQDIVLVILAADAVEIGSPAIAALTALFSDT